MDINVSSLLPSYEAIMDMLTTLLEGCNKPIEPKNVIRLLKAQYDK
jgi:hypothetical protein